MAVTNIFTDNGIAPTTTPAGNRAGVTNIFSSYKDTSPIVKPKAVQPVQQPKPIAQPVTTYIKDVVKTNVSTLDKVKSTVSSGWNYLSSAIGSGLHSFATNPKVQPELENMKREFTKIQNYGLLSPAPVGEGNVDMVEGKTIQKPATPKAGEDWFQKVTKEASIFMNEVLGGVTFNNFESKIPKTTIPEKIAGVSGQVVGTGVAIKNLNGILTDISLKNATLVTAMKNYPKVTKILYPILKNVLSFDIYGQLQIDQKNRAQRLAFDTALGITTGGLGFIKNAPLSIVSNFSLGYGLAKAGGLSNEDALITGGVLAFMDTGNRLQQSLFQMEITKNGIKDMNPQDAINSVIGTPLENTPFGKQIIRLAIEAQATGEKVRISVGVKKPAKVAQILGNKKLSTGELAVELVPANANAQIGAGATKTKPSGDIRTTFLAKKGQYTSASDLAQGEYGQPPTAQIGFMSPETIIARDPVDPAQVRKVEAEIQAGKTIEPIIVSKVDGKLTTVDGTQRLTAFQNQGQPVPVIYTGKDAIEGLSTFEKEFGTATEKKPIVTEEKSAWQIEKEKNVIETYGTTPDEYIKKYYEGHGYPSQQGFEYYVQSNSLNLPNGMTNESILARAKELYPEGIPETHEEYEKTKEKQIHPELIEMRKTTLPEYNQDKSIESLDAFVDKVRELNPDDELDAIQIKYGNKYEVTVSYPHSLGENGNQTDYVYKTKPTPEDIAKDILDTYKEEKININKEVVPGVTAKSGRDENIEKAIDEAMKKKPSQKEQVKQVIGEKEKSIKDIAKETDILEPNVRRILGMGAKEGVFERVDKGVYKIKTPDGSEVAYIMAGDALETLPKLASEGFKADMVFLDIPYAGEGNRGGNRMNEAKGTLFETISPEQFGSFVKSVALVVRNKNTPVIYMFSQSKTSKKTMDEYASKLTDEGFIPLARGDYYKMSKDGKRLTMPMRSDPLPPEGIIIFNQTGEYDFKKPPELQFKLVRPRGYKTEKPAEMIRDMIEMTTDEGDVVLDPFAGSGVVPAEAVKAKRVGVAIEKDKNVVENIIKPRVEAEAKKIQGKEWELKSSRGYPVITGNPPIVEESKYGLKVGDRIIEIGVPGKNGKETSSHRVQTFEEPVIYEGTVTNIGLPGKQLSFKYVENGETYHLLYTAMNSGYILATDATGKVNMQYSAVFKKQKGKRIGMMDYHPSYTPHMNELIKEAQDNGDLFPYTKMSPEEQKILDNAFRETIGNIPIASKQEVQTQGEQKIEPFNVNTEPPTEAVSEKTPSEKAKDELTLVPSEAGTPEEQFAEAMRLGIPEKYLKVGGKESGSYNRPAIGRSDLKILLKNMDEFKKNPIFIVDDEKNLVFRGKRSSMTITPEALQLNAERLKVGDRIKVDVVKMNKAMKGTQQVRVNRGGTEFASIGDYAKLPNMTEKSPYAPTYTPRGEWTLEKVIYNLRNNSRYFSGELRFNKELTKFDSPKEVQENLYFHGTGGFVSGGLKPSIILPKDNFMGGGYDQRYYVVSLSKSKNSASNFSGISNTGTVYPVLLRKGAKVISMPNIEDAIELEEIIPKLWADGVDAVKIGHWEDGFSEQELAVVNPTAIVRGEGESYRVYQKEKFEQPTIDEITTMWKESGKKVETYLSEKGIKPKLQTEQMIKDFNAKMQSGSTGASIGNYAILKNMTTDETKRPDMPSYKVVPFPEIVRIVKELTGKSPQVVRRMGQALGRAYPGGLDIKLATQIFSDPDTASRVLAHELGHITDYLPEGTKRRGNLLGRIASLNGYLKHFLSEFPGGLNNTLTPKDKYRLKQEAKRLSEIPVTETKEVITGERLPTPEEILDIWRTNTSDITSPELLTYIKTLSTELKKDIIKSALKSQIPKWVTFKNTVKETITAGVIRNSPEDIQRLYKKLVEEEIIKRRLLSLDTIKQELTGLSAEWRPFDRLTSNEGYIKYRDTPSELYADAISVLYNDPERLKVTAPEFYRGFFNYLDQKPEVAEVYASIQDLINGGTENVNKARLDDLYKGFEEGAKKRREITDKEIEGKSLLFKAMTRHVSRFHPAYEKLNKLIKEKKITMDEKQKVRAVLEEMAMARNDIWMDLMDNERSVMKPLKDVGITDKELGAWFTLERNLNERNGLANPGGLIGKYAQELKDYMEKNFTPVQQDALKEAVRIFHEKTFAIVDEMYKEGMISEKIFKEKIEPFRDTYVTYGVVKYIDKDYVNPYVKTMTGTLEAIENPLVTTMYKRSSMLQAIAVHKAKTSIRDLLKNYFPDEISLAPSTLGMSLQRIFRTTPGKGQLKMLENGKWTQYDVDPYFEAMFKHFDPKDLHTIVELVGKFNRVFKPIVTTYKLGWAMWNNPLRDVQRTMRNIASVSQMEGTRFNPLEYLATWLTTIPEGYKFGGGQLSQMAEMAVKGKAMSTPYVSHDPTGGEDRALATLYEKFNFLKSKDTLTRAGEIRKKLLIPIEMVLKALERTGTTFESTTKLAGFKYLYKKMKDTTKASFYTRNYVGTPNYIDGGTLKDTDNNIMVFSNVIIQGMRTDLELMANPKSRGAYFTHVFLQNTIWKLLMLAMAGGFLGKKLRDMYKKISEYNKTNYLAFPIYELPSGKVIYFSIPQDEINRLAGAMTWKAGTAMMKELKKPGQLLDVGAGVFPTMTPIFDIISAWFDYARGINPYDSFYGRNVLTQQDAQIRGVEGAKEMSLWTLNQMGLGNFATYDPQKDTTTESILRFSPLINRMFKVSDYGLTEEAQVMQAEEQRVRAVQNKKEADIVDENVKRYLDKGGNAITYYQKIQSEIYPNGMTTPEEKSNMSRLKKDFDKAVAGKTEDVRYKTIMNLQLNTAKVQALKTYRKDLSYSEYIGLVNRLYEDKMISKDVYKQVK